MGGAYSTHGRDAKSIQNFGRKICRERPLRRPKRRGEDNIRMDLREISWKVYVAQERDRQGLL